MRKCKSLLTVLLCVLLTLTFVVGCAGVSDPVVKTTEKVDKKEEVTSGDRDPYTISCLFSDHASQPYQEETWILPKVIKEKFNITMDMQAVPSSAFTEKRNTTLASGDIPDIIMGMDKLVADDYGKKGMFLNFMDYKDIMPNMILGFEKYEYLVPHMVSPTEFYVMPGQSFTMGDLSGAAYLLPTVRMDVLNDLGISPPVTYDDLYDMFVEMKKAYPDSYL